jgi:hypothetical protein
MSFAACAPLWSRTAVTLCLGFAGVVLPLAGQESKLSPDLLPVAAEEVVEVIIQLEDPPEGRAAGRLPAAFPRPASLSARGPVRELNAIRGLVTRVNGSSLSALARDPQVKYISPNRELSAATNWGTASVGAISLQAKGFKGRGVGVAVIDSGVVAHPDLDGTACRL